MLVGVNYHLTVMQVSFILDLNIKKPFYFLNKETVNDVRC